MFLVYFLSSDWTVNHLFMATPEDSKKNVFVYILLMANGNYYTGWTTDLKRRLDKHRTGKGAKLTRAFKTESLAAAWSIAGTKSEALKIEAFIKRKSRKEKEEFVKTPERLEMEFNRESQAAVAIAAWDKDVTLP